VITWTGNQATITAAESKDIHWLFEITKSGSGSVDHYWSTKNHTFDSQAYTAKILPDSFDSITLRRSGAEVEIQAPDDLTFSIDNADGSLTDSDYIDAQVHVKQIQDDGTNEEIIRQWKFTIVQPKEVYGEIKCECVDFLQQYIKGDHPNTPLVSTIFPDDTEDVGDDLCIPQIFGTAYIPLRSAYITDGRYYLLGLSSHT